MSYSDPTTDIKARRAEQERIHLELLAGVNNLLGPNSMPMRLASTFVVSRYIDGVILNHNEAEAFIAHGITEIEDSLGAVADVQGIWGELDDA